MLMRHVSTLNTRHKTDYVGGEISKVFRAFIAQVVDIMSLSAISH